MNREDIAYNNYINSLSRGAKFVRRDYFYNYPTRLLEKYKFLTETDYYNLVRSEYLRGYKVKGVKSIKYTEKGFWTNAVEMNSIMNEFYDSFMVNSKRVTDEILDLSRCTCNASETGVIDENGVEHGFDSMEFRRGYIMYICDNLARNADIDVAYFKYTGDKFRTNFFNLKVSKIKHGRVYSLLRFTGTDGIVDCSDTNLGILSILDNMFTIIYATESIVIARGTYDKSLFALQYRVKAQEENYLFNQSGTWLVYEIFRQSIIQRDYLFSFLFTFFCYAYTLKETDGSLLKQKCNFEKMEA